jgi:hypothetical protein
MTRKKWLWIGIGLLAFAIAVTLSYGEALREQLLRPILYELWLWELRLESLPFGLIWLLFLVLASLSVYRATIDVVFQGRRRVATQENATRLGPVKTLSHKIELACQGELARWNVHRVLSDIAIGWIALREGVTESEARRRLRAGEILAELHEALRLEFPASPAQRGWWWLSERLLPVSPDSKRRRLQELSQLTQILENFSGETYERTHDRR